MSYEIQDMTRSRTFYLVTRLSYSVLPVYDNKTETSTIYEILDESI
jgi:hypothetical protein